MTPNRLIAIGDIHGEFDKLRRLLNVVAPTSSDQIVFLGDYINRGKNSFAVINRLLELQQEFPQTIFLRGNHEQILLDALVEVGKRSGCRLCDFSEHFKNLGRSCALDQFLSNGGNATLHSYRVSDLIDAFPQDHIEFIETTRLWWIYQDFIFVHAGAYSDIPIEEQDPGILLWDRMSPAGETGKIHVVGHQPMSNGKPHFEPGRYYLDTGAAYGRALTACDVFTLEFWQAE